MAGMVSFSPEDVIFVLNKWDTISHEHDDKMDKFYEETKAYLREVWDKVDETRIFKISAKKVSLCYIIYFNKRKLEKNTYQSVTKEFLSKKKNS